MKDIDYQISGISLTLLPEGAALRRVIPQHLLRCSASSSVTVREEDPPSYNSVVTHMLIINKHLLKAEK